MSPTITLEEAQTKRPELIGNPAPGEEIITQAQQPVAKLVGGHSPGRKPVYPETTRG